MQPPKEYKFLQEQVFDGIWPFNKFKSPTNVFLLTLVYIIWGLALFVIFEIPPYFILAGTFSAFGLFLWTIGIFKYADKLRKVEIERINVVNRKFLIGFLENLFHPSSIVIGVIVFTAVSTYFFSSTSFGVENLLISLRTEMNVETLPPLLLLFVFLMAFDLCYRLGLSLYVILVQIRRNFRLTQYLESPVLKTHFSPIDIRNLEKADYFHYLAISGGLSLFPLGFLDPTLLIMLSTYIFVTFFLSAVNILHLRLLYSRAIPQGLLTLLQSGKFAKVGSISSGGFPHITPTLFVFDGRHIFIGTSNKSKKVKNLRKLKNVAVFIDSRKEEDITKSVGVLIIGRARVYGHDIPTGILYFLILGYRMFRVYLLFYRKYPHYIAQYRKENQNLPRAWQIFPILSRTIIEIVPEKFFFWKVSRPTLVEF